jgi:hypothetical protein
VKSFVELIGATRFPVPAINAVDVIEETLCKLRCLTFKSYWLRDAPTDITFNCAPCPHCIHEFRIYLKKKQRLVPLTP